MMAKGVAKKWLEGETGMSFTEFSYQLIQGYDYYWLYITELQITNGGQLTSWGQYCNRDETYPP